ncbi:site-specific integrase [Kineothrix sedimenti]|uniref:Site-specific integrase n=1 Tax=Kineothrix sedimenti TaxID=3123317 RepID=A0ABZ3EV27_9FIRM
MARKGENIYKRKDGRWEGRIRRSDGTFKYFYAKTYKAVRMKMKDFLVLKIPCKVQSVSRPENASELFEQWIKGEICFQVKPSTYESYFFCVQNYVIPFFQKTENRYITEESVCNFIKYIWSADISDSSKKKNLIIFKRALKEVLAMKPEQLSLLAYIKIPKIEDKEIKIFSIKEQQELETTILHSQDKRALGILLCFYTGIRLGELCALKWSDIDIEAGTISILRTVSRIRCFDPEKPKTALTVRTPKSKKSMRVLPMPDFLLKMTDEFDVNHMDKGCYIISGQYEPMEPRSFQSLYKKQLADAGLPERKFHAIRHTFATRALELGVDIKTLSELLGHSSVSITLNIYTHSLMEHKKVAINKLNSIHVLSEHNISYAVNDAVKDKQ